MSVQAKKYAYPTSRKGDDVTLLHGKTIADPFRWLEDPDCPEVVSWVKEQQVFTASYFDAVDQKRARILARLEQLQNYPRAGCPFTRGGVSFQYRNTGLQNQDVFYKTTSGIDSSAGFDDAVALMDLNAMDPAGTTSLGSCALSDDGALFAYGLCRGGSDWQELHIRDVSTGADLSDSIPWAKFTSLAWLKDGSGFFYTRYPAPKVDATKAGTETTSTQYSMVCLHFIGTRADDDLLVWAEPTEPSWILGCEVTEDGEYLLVSTSYGTDPVNKLSYAHLPSVLGAWKPASLGVARALESNSNTPPLHESGSYLLLTKFVDSFDAQWEYVSNDGPRFLFKTNLRAPKYCIVAAELPVTPPTSSEGAAAIPPVAVVVPECDAVLVWATVVANTRLLTCHLRHVTHALAVHLLQGDLSAVSLADTPSLVRAAVDLALPGPGTIAGFSGRRVDLQAFFKFVSFLDPGLVMRLDFRSDAAIGAESVSIAHPDGATLAVLTPWKRTLLPGFDASEFTATQSFVTSDDGTAQLPIFVVRRKTASSSPRPTLLYGYGGFNVNLGPSFSAMRLVWLQELDGVYVMACIRGGGEYGEAWHQAGARFNKQNCFDDFAAVARHLTTEGVATSNSLGIMGGSNGGLLTLACALQHPELYGAAVAQVPVTDMLRYHKWTVGALWAGEYLNCETDPAALDYQLTYSPLHNVRPPASAAEALPSILITTADHDDRVVPAHSFKMAAALQMIAGSSPFQDHPLLVRIESNAGHGAGKPTSKVLAELADTYTFLITELSKPSTVE